VDGSDLDGVSAEIEAAGGRVVDAAFLTGAPAEAARIVFRGPVNALALRARSARRLGEERGLGVGVRSAELWAAIPGLWVMDVDSTLIEEEVIDELARVAGRYDEVAEITRRAMRGELDFRASLAARCGLLAGLPQTVFDDVRHRLHVRTGARRLLAALRAVGCRTAVVSGGFRQTVEPMATELGLDYVEANELEVVDGFLTGKTVGPIVDAARKAAFFDALVDELALPRTRTVAVGDGANDLPMVGRAGLGIAYRAKPKLRGHADAAVDLPRLDATIHHLGWSEADLDELAAGGG